MRLRAGSTGHINALAVLQALLQYAKETPKEEAFSVCRLDLLHRSGEEYLPLDQIKKAAP